MPRNRKIFRKWLQEIFDPYLGPPQTRWSLWADLFILLAILASCALVLVELIYVPDVSEAAAFHRIVIAGELLFTVIFTAEYLLRWYAAPSRLGYPFTFFAFVDLVAILPSVVMLIAHFGMGGALLTLRVIRGVRLLRVLRLLRLLRLLKFLRYGFTIFRLVVNLRIYVSAIFYHYRLWRLGRLLLWVVIAWLVGTNAVYLSEYLLADPTDQSPYAASYWRSYWNVIVVLISGMDTDTPVTLLGRIEIALLLVAGICVVGMFTGELVSILVRSAQRSGLVDLKPPSLRLEQHIVIIGRNRRIENLIAQINAALGTGHYILIVAADADELPAPPGDMSRRVFALRGDPARDDILSQANIADALRVVVLSSEYASKTVTEMDNKSMMRALAVVARHRDVPLVVELADPDSLRYTDVLDTAECLVTQHFGERLISQAVINPRITEVYNELMTLSEANEFFSVPVPEELVGKTFQQAQEFFLDQDGEPMVLVGIDEGGHPFEDFRLGSDNPRSDVLEESHRLIIIAEQRPSFASVSHEDLWTGKILVRSSSGW